MLAQRDELPLDAIPFVWLRLDGCWDRGLPERDALFSTVHRRDIALTDLGMDVKGGLIGED